MAEEDVVKISRSFVLGIVGAVVLLLIAIYAMLTPLSLGMDAYTISFIVAVILIGWGSLYFYKSHQHLNEMCCMMNSMVFSMIASFVIGAIIAIPTGDFILGIVVGTIVGFIIGIPLGKLGGHLSRMEGIMAAPMGGSMGAMLGIMIRFYNIQLFMQFLLLVMLFIVIEMTRINYSHLKESHEGAKMPSTVLYSGAIITILVLSSVFMLNFSVNNSATGIVFAQNAPAAQPPAAAPNGAVQEVTIKMETFNYNPDYITVKKGIPVRVNLEASPNAGCTRSIVFPDFGISKVVDRGGKATVEFTPQKEGTFVFRCSMAMARGTLVVTN